MPELASKVLKQQQTGGVESHQTQPGSYPHNSQHDAQNTQPQPPHADAFRSGKGVQEDAHQCGMHTDAHAQEEAEEVSADARMTMVFDDRDRAQNSDDHLKHVAEQYALSHSLKLESIRVAMMLSFLCASLLVQMERIYMNSTGNTWIVGNWNQQSTTPQHVWAQGTIRLQPHVTTFSPEHRMPQLGTGCATAPILIT